MVGNGKHTKERRAVAQLCTHQKAGEGVQTSRGEQAPVTEASGRGEGACLVHIPRHQRADVESPEGDRGARMDAPVPARSQYRSV